MDREEFSLRLWSKGIVQGYRRHDWRVEGREVGPGEQMRNRDSFVFQLNTQHTLAQSNCRPTERESARARERESESERERERARESEGERGR